MSKYFEAEQLEEYLKKQDKPNIKYLDKDGKMSKLDYIIFKIEKMEKLIIKSLKCNELNNQ